MNRIKDKIEEINKFLDEFKGIIPSSLREYESNIEKKAACERYFKKILEAVTDLAFLIIKDKKFIPRIKPLFYVPEDEIRKYSLEKKYY